jgi:hypothetical protein
MTIKTVTLRLVPQAPYDPCDCPDEDGDQVHGPDCTKDYKPFEVTVKVGLWVWADNGNDGEGVLVEVLSIQEEA